MMEDGTLVNEEEKKRRDEGCEQQLTREERGGRSEDG